MKNKLLIIFLLALILLTSCTEEYKDLDLSHYQYQETKELVKFVYRAAKRIERDGMSSISYFKEHRNKYMTKQRYLYIFDMDDNNLFHAGMPEIEGKNLLNIRDINGKLITHLIFEALNDKNNPHSWVHYSWWQPGSFYPVPKSSCHFKVRTPEGKTLFVGGGLNYPHEEVEFIKIIVNSAAQLIKDKGVKALDIIKDPSSQYTFRDVHVFAFRGNGQIIISPVLGDSLFILPLLKCKDEVGQKPFAKALKQIVGKENTSVVFLAKNKSERLLNKKYLYVKKAYLNDSLIYLGAITNLPKPPF